MIRTIEERIVYENGYVRVFDDRVRFADGHEGSYYYARWKAPYGVGVVAVRKDGHVLLLRNYRYADRAMSLEIPLGFGVAGAEPREQAAAELREEAGLEAESLEELLLLGGCYRTHVFLARVRDPAEVTLAGQEATEAIAGFEWVAPGDLGPARLASRGVYEAITMASLLAARDRL